MGEFLIECTLCGVSFGSEKLYEGHPCMDDDVKVPFKIKMEQDDEEAELEEEVQKVIDQATKSCKIEPIIPSGIKEEPVDVDFEDEDPLGGTREDEFVNGEENLEDIAEPIDASDILENNQSSTDDTVGKPVNECAVCGKRFFRREDFLTHKANAHKIPRPYECKVCKKRFTQKHYVALHMRVHTGERPYKCGLCSNTYTHKTSFTIHMRIHNGDRPYRCGLCGKRCYDKSGLTSHMRSHTKETPYECEVCGRRFTHSKSLLVHRRNHTGEKPYKCPYCGKTFRHWHKHKIHIRLHTGERPYRCKICGKGFPRNDEVKRHMRSHQGIKSFKCSICSVYCATQASITGHIDLHHSDLKPDNPTAPEKTVVRNSMSGILGTKAPQPRTIYKPIASLASSVINRSTCTTAKSPEGIVIAGKKGCDGKPKALSYKEYIELQEKMLADKGLMVKNPKEASCPISESLSNKVRSSSKKNKSSPSSQTALSNNGKQILIISPQNMQAGAGTGVGNMQFVLSRQMSAPPPAQTATPGSNVGGQQLILGQPSVVLPQPQLLGGQVLGSQQIILLSPSGSQQNNLNVSQPLLLLTGSASNGGQRLLLLPKQGTSSGICGNPVMMIPSSIPVGTNVPESNEVSPSVQIKKEVEDQVPAVNEEETISTIKQEPGVTHPFGVVIKQEPSETDPLLFASVGNIVIKQEPEDMDM
ncbi:zinc finger and BTB domain-containing protein 24-like [Macrobrachium nipponense]|uniref:zinc finger and BTB domain-containing protein 24-like n=1 Tax=Macrobrachium nipponense TaxID=159736 RepID=UPI0030C810F1